MEKPLCEPDAVPSFVAYTAHGRPAERRALIDFMAHVRSRRAEHPGMHIYLYAPYEVTALKRQATRHAVMEDEVAELASSGAMWRGSHTRCRHGWPP